MWYIRWVWESIYACFEKFKPNLQWAFCLLQTVVVAQYIYSYKLLQSFDVWSFSGVAEFFITTLFHIFRIFRHLTLPYFPEEHVKRIIVVSVWAKRCAREWICKSYVLKFVWVTSIFVNFRQAIGSTSL